MKNYLFTVIWALFSISSTALLGLANPASQFCVDSGGKVYIEKRGDGGEYGICDLGDNQLCEEWALLRRKCPPQGVKVTGFDTPQQVYCVIQGGSLSEDQGECILSSGAICKLEALWNGQCDEVAVLKDSALMDITKD
ncbi:DUF333 domain-containing protein [Candidatus Bealeia paramacronuclearis]|uniref:DUF333 domain-containing protein n=1 Tax=Candidatus Bealeia paramacronuclearis TaxID=1921001 RepID=A0ABZ2C508_9PROT|nr:hypothetical protein [Candidatus Bealeia paramacronuclearis]